MTRPLGLTGISMTLLTAASTLVICGCGASSSTPPTTSTTSVAATTVATTSVPPVTTSAAKTSVYAPTAAQSTPDAAVALLVQDWSAGKRSAAAAIANPPSVAGLFAQPYPSGYLQDRGCTAASVNPGDCDYRNTDTNSLYEFGVSQGSSGWYVSSFTFED